MDKRTLRCKIRSFRVMDAEDVHAFASLPEVAYAANFLPHRSITITQENIRRWMQVDDIFAVELIEEEKVIGAISFRPDALSPAGWYKIGYTCHPAYQGKGYMTEALRKVMDHLIYKEEVPGVALHIFIDNLPSLRLALRCGFKPSGDQTTKQRFDGKSVVEETFRQTREDYQHRFEGKWLGEIRSSTKRDVLENQIIRRHAVRGIVRQNDKILLIQSSLKDVKFPGGGIEAGESIEEALKREIKEESGYTVDKIARHRGYIEEWTDAFESDEHVFAMRSDFYDVMIKEKQDALKLDDYEAELGFHPVWMTIDEALQANMDCPSPKRWTKRDTKILGIMKHEWENGDE